MEIIFKYGNCGRMKIECTASVQQSTFVINSMNQFTVSTGLTEGDLVGTRLRLSFLVTYNVCNPIASRDGSKLIYATVNK